MSPRFGRKHAEKSERKARHRRARKMQRAALRDVTTRMDMVQWARYDADVAREFRSGSFKEREC